MDKIDLDIALVPLLKYANGNGFEYNTVFLIRKYGNGILHWRITLTQISAANLHFHKWPAIISRKPIGGITLKQLCTFTNGQLSYQESQLLALNNFIMINY